MTDTAQVDDSSVEIPGGTDGPAGEVSPSEHSTDPAEPVRFCGLPECPNEIPPRSVDYRGPDQKYCNEHKGNSPAARKIRRQWLKDHGITDGPDSGKHSADRPPRIAVDLGGGKGKKGKGPAKPATAEELAAVEARAKQITKGLAILMLMGTPDDRRRADAADVLNNADALAAALKNLAVYEPSVRALGVGGEMSDRAQAWLQVGAVSLAMTMPILVRHEIVKGQLAQVAAMFTASPGEVSIPVPGE